VVHAGGLLNRQAETRIGAVQHIRFPEIMLGLPSDSKFRLEVIES